MQSARSLRDKSGNTRLLILAQLQQHPGSTLSDVAGHLGVTVQAVSSYARDLAADGAMTGGPGGYRVTPRGLGLLHEGTRRLRDAVEAVTAPLRDVRVASAVAHEPIRAQQPVGLFMEAGDLVARPGAESTSRGIARQAAGAGEEVVVGDLEGIVDLMPGRLTIVALPAPVEGGTARVDSRVLADLLSSRGRADRVGALDTGARILARRLLGRLDLEFAADHAAFNAAERGLDVLLFASRDHLPDVMRAMDHLNARTLRRVPVELVEAPEATPRTRRRGTASGTGELTPGNERAGTGVPS